MLALKIVYQDVSNTYVGSLARLRNRHTFSIEPFSSKSCLKNRAVSMLTYIKQYTHFKDQITFVSLVSFYVLTLKALIRMNNFWHRQQNDNVHCDES